MKKISFLITIIIVFFVFQSKAQIFDSNELFDWHDTTTTVNQPFPGS